MFPQRNLSESQITASYWRNSTVKAFDIDMKKRVEVNLGGE